MNYKAIFILLVSMSLNAHAQLRPIATNIASPESEEGDKVLREFDMNRNGCLRGSAASEFCMSIKKGLTGRKFDESVVLPNDWGHSVEERRKAAIETYNMKFSPSVGYRIKSCFGFCADEEKHEDTLSVADGPRNRKEYGAPHDTIADTERSFYERADVSASKNNSK